ncbi:dual specificity protein phosphatase 12 [Microthyrium microscopicum]|uniref:protein-tyrosine-phosphatase n=1 Tax=Microthyrium microscopicum TaxID=703497 RepID=A0A6A6ULJ2_9PEZI|nr:dual specificity protein phosphatase 12 [Microthyrium microscopicum]
MSLLDKIPGTNVYIGGIFTLRRKAQLEQASITHVLSVLRMPGYLDRDKELFAGYKCMLVEVDDVEDENLLQHFKATNAFIQNGLDSGGSVLVHCAMGKSRSGTCCVAYMMQKFQISPTEALEQIRQVRPIVEPNEGFMQQLDMYHRMQMTEDVESSPVYQRWMYQREVQLSSDCGQAPDADKIRFEDEHVSASSSSEPVDSEYRCRKCRRALATSKFLIPHRPPPHNEPFPAALTCAHLFMDPLSWMRPELEQGKLEGRLECPKCKSNVGKYAWQGMRCSCGAWVVPAITLARAKIDETHLNRGSDNSIRRGPGVGMPATRAEGRGLL